MQTQKYKAIQLVKAFYVETTTSTEAKQCALICVDMMLQEIPKRFDSEEIYWEEVKKEIEKL